MSKYDRQCHSCGGICRASGCERENVPLEPQPRFTLSKNLRSSVMDGLIPSDLSRIERGALAQYMGGIADLKELSDMSYIEVWTFMLMVAEELYWEGV